MAFAASWKPFVKSKKSATATTATSVSSTNAYVMRLLGLLGGAGKGGAPEGRYALGARPVRHEPSPEGAASCHQRRQAAGGARLGPAGAAAAQEP
jgi:hypothetical protein